MNNSSEGPQLLINAIKDMDLQFARILILENNIRPVEVNEEDMFHFIRNVALLNDNPLLKQIVACNSQVAGKVLWSLLDRIDLATKLVEEGADINVRQDECYKVTFLHVLLENNKPGNFQLAKKMIAHGANVHAVDIEGRSVLKCAIEGGAPEDIIQLLLLTADAHFARNVVTIAESHRAAELMPLLITAGSAGGPTRSRRACDAIFHLIDFLPDKVDTIQSLFQYDVPIDVVDYKGYTALHNAVIKTYEDVVELLLKRNADPNQRTPSGQLPLWIASTLMESSISTLLIKYGADVHDENANGQRPIHGACKGGSLCNALLLTRLGAGVNVVDNKGNTPFSLLTENLTPHVQSLYRFVLRRLALAAFKGDEINARDMSMIRASRTTQEYYDASFNELQRMQRIGAAAGIPYYTLLVGSVDRTSRFTRTEEGLSRAFADQRGLRELFPYYFCDLRNAYVFAKEREGLVMAKERYVEEPFTEIFQVSFPHPIINKIANYLCSDELNHFTLDFHLRTFPQMIWE